MSQTFTDDCYHGTHVAATDLQNMENNFAALKSSFSGAGAPSNPIAGMWWFDTTANILKLRNEANNAWQSVWNFANNKPVIANLSNEITNAMCASALKDPVAGTAGLRTLGTGSTQAAAGNDSRFGIPNDGSVTFAKFPDYEIGDSLLASANTDRVNNGTGHVLVKAITINRGGNLRIKFSIACLYPGGGRAANAQIYRGTTPVGTVRRNTLTSYVEYSEDISGWTSSDSVRLYLWCSISGDQAHAQNFRLYRAVTPETVVTTD